MPKKVSENLFEWKDFQVRDESPESQKPAKFLVNVIQILYISCRIKNLRLKMNNCKNREMGKIS